MILSIISLIPILLMFFWGVKFKTKNEIFKDCMELKYTGCLRGMSAILILIHHFSGYLVNNNVFSSFTHIGYLIVALFFFFSGYGLMYGFKSRKNYVQINVFFNRFLKIVIPYWCTIIIYIIVNAFKGHFYSMQEILISFISPDNIVAASWYIFELVILYLMFFIVFKFMKKNQIVYLSTILFIFILITKLTNFSDLWYRSIIGFLLGVIIAEHQDVIFKLLQKKYFGTFFMTFMFFLFFCIGRLLCVKYEMVNIQIIFDIATSAFFVILVFILIHKIRFYNGVLDKLGKCSYEIYLIHMLIINNYYPYFKNSTINIFVFLWLCIITTVIAGLLFNNINKFFISKTIIR